MFQKAILLAVLFVLVASPATYKLTSGVLGRWVASAGCATQAGAVLHAAVFATAALAAWKLLDGGMETWKQPGIVWGYLKCNSASKSCTFERLRATDRFYNNGQVFWNHNTRKFEWLSSREQTKLQFVSQ